MAVLTIDQGTDRSVRVVQLMNEGRFEEAVAAAELWIMSNPHNAEAYGMLAQIYLKAGKLNQALYWSDEALRYDAENTKAWFVRVSVLYAQEEDRAFFKAVKEAQRLDPYEAHYYFLKFNSYRRSGRLHEAREELGKALYMSPENGLYKAADCYMQAVCGAYEASRSSEKGALMREPADTETFLFLVIAAKTRGEYDKALGFVKKAIKMNPSDPELRAEYIDSLRYAHLCYRLLHPFIALFLLLYAGARWTSKLSAKVNAVGWRSKKRPPSHLP